MQLREACPPHKQNELVSLVKSLKGDEEKCRKKISEWWDEPVVAQEAAWEDVNKKHPKKSRPQTSSGRGGRGRGPGRGGRGRGGDTGRTGRGRGGRVIV